jgi:hypothetical protein
MKNLFLAFVAFFSINTTFAQGTTEPPKSDPPVIEFQFGRKSRDCAGIGVCVFRVNLTASQIIKFVTAFAVPGGNVLTGLLRVQFAPEFYNANRNHFSNGFLVLEEDLTLDKETTRATGLPDNYKLRKGKYRVTFDGKTNTYNCTM